MAIEAWEKRKELILDSKREWALRIALVLSSIGFTLLLIELLLRLLGYSSSVNANVILHEELGHVFAIGAFDDSVNSDGFLTKEFPESNLTDNARIVLIGDSFVATSALQASDRLDRQLENALGAGVEVYSLGVDGYGTSQSVLAWLNYGEPIQPQISMFFFYINDIRDNLYYTKFTVSSENIVSHYDEAWARKFLALLRRNSVLFSMASDGLSDLISNINSVELETQDDTNSTNSLDLSDYVAVEKAYYQFPNLEVFESEWEQIRIRLRIWVNSSKEIGASPVLIYIPSRDEIDVMSSYPDTVQAYPIENQAPNRLDEICAQIDCEFIDLKNVFIEHELSGERLYQPDNLHWGTKGVELAAETIATLIK